MGCDVQRGRAPGRAGWLAGPGLLCGDAPKTSRIWATNCEARCRSKGRTVPLRPEGPTWGDRKQEAQAWSNARVLLKEDHSQKRPMSCSLYSHPTPKSCPSHSQVIVPSLPLLRFFARVSAVV